MEPKREENENQRRKLWLLPLLALIMSLFCVYSSTYLALSLWPTEITNAQMLAENRANYGRDQSSVQFAPVSTQIILQATKDSLGLSLTPTPFNIDASNPPEPENPVQIADVVETPTKSLPPAVVTTATHTPRPTSEPNTPTPFPTSEPSATPIPTATATATDAPPVPPANTIAPTATAVPPTATPLPTWTPVPPAPPPPPAPPTATPQPTATVPPLPPTFTPTVASTATSTATATATATVPPTNTSIPTPTATPTATATPTSGPPPCSGNIPGGEPNIGNPNGSYAAVGCGQSFIVDLGAPNAITVNDGAEPAFDLVYYEHENPATMINLDWVIVEIGRSNTGPWVQVFYWGDDLLDSNTNIGQANYGNGSEPDNYPIPFADLYGGNSPGVAIDVDAFAQSGTYRWVRITSPLGGDNDAAEVDAIMSLP